MVEKMPEASIFVKKQKKEFFTMTYLYALGLFPWGHYVRKQHRKNTLLDPVIFTGVVLVGFFILFACFHIIFDVYTSEDQHKNNLYTICYSIAMLSPIFITVFIALFYGSLHYFVQNIKTTEVIFGINTRDLIYESHGETRKRVEKQLRALALALLEFQKIFPGDFPECKQAKKKFATAYKLATKMGFIQDVGWGPFFPSE